MTFITDFGDSAVLLPVAAAILAWLLFTRSVMAGVWWGAALILCGAGIGLLKILFFACPPAGDLESPSGHTALSILIYGGLATIVAAETRAVWARRAVVAFAVLLVSAIGASRLALHFHSLREIAIGLLVGGGTLSIFVAGYRRQAKRRERIALLLFSALILIAVLHGLRLRPENRLHALSAYLHLQTLACP